MTSATTSSPAFSTNTSCLVKNRLFKRAALLLGAIVTIMLAIVLILLALPEVIGPKRR